MPDQNSEIVPEIEELFPFEMGYLPEEFQEKAIVQLNETARNKEQSLREMKDMIELDKTLLGVEIDDDLIVQFLRSEKYDVQEAFTRLKNLINFKRDNMEMFTGQRYETISKSIIDNITTYLPFRCRDGCAIIHVNVDNWIPDEFPVLEVKRMAPILLLQALREPMTQVNGFKAIINAKSNPLRHLRYCSFQNLYLMYYGSQFCLPGKFHSYHVVNMSFTGRFCLQLMRTILPEELKKKIHIHATPEQLLDHFPAEIIPEIYGGQLGRYDLTGWLKKVMEPEELEKLGGKFLS
ncbi:Clavesin-2 like protein [Argiope bruennichi]|uniref:Clavesin-2 like protein n=1 Tax=Argiope bruennichi TaxID=94029 RepID=A0A8T0ERR6_ARGBR|nr:Clavesin-2 like protein [Argiope bruennichi]